MAFGAPGSGCWRRGRGERRKGRGEVCGGITKIGWVGNVGRCRRTKEEEGFFGGPVGCMERERSICMEKKVISLE